MAPIFKVGDIRWGRNHKKEGSLGEKQDFTQKRGCFDDEIPNKMCFFFFKNLWKILYFLNKLVIFFLSKNKKIWGH